jgi:hypothetical protein
MKLLKSEEFLPNLTVKVCDSCPSPFMIFDEVIDCGSRTLASARESGRG